MKMTAGRIMTPFITVAHCACIISFWTIAAATRPYPASRPRPVRQTWPSLKSARMPVPVPHPARRSAQAHHEEGVDENVEVEGGENVARVVVGPEADLVAVMWGVRDGAIDLGAQGGQRCWLAVLGPCGDTARRDATSLTRGDCKSVLAQPNTGAVACPRMNMRRPKSRLGLHSLTWMGTMTAV